MVEATLSYPPPHQGGVHPLAQSMRQKSQPKKRADCRAKCAAAPVCTAWLRRGAPAWGTVPLPIIPPFTRYERQNFPPSRRYCTSTRPFTLDLAGAGPSQRRVRIGANGIVGRARPTSQQAQNKEESHGIEQDTTLRGGRRDCHVALRHEPTQLSRRSGCLWRRSGRFRPRRLPAKQRRRSSRYGYGSHPRRKDAFQRSGAARLRRGGDRRWHIRHLCSSGCSPGGRQDRHRGENRPHWRPVELLHVHRGRRHCAPTGRRIRRHYRRAVCRTPRILQGHLLSSPGAHHLRQRFRYHRLAHGQRARDHRLPRRPVGPVEPAPQPRGVRPHDDGSDA